MRFGLLQALLVLMLVAQFAALFEHAAQIVLLGANVGTALTALVVSAGVGAIAPALLLGGYGLSRRAKPLWAGTGRALIGIGLLYAFYFKPYLIHRMKQKAIEQARAEGRLKATVEAR